MSVSYAILGLLEQEPNHGYELKRRYDRFFGRERPVAYGQVYSTLSRLARDGRVSEGGSLPGEGPERKLYAITPEGTAAVQRWLMTPEPPEPHLQTVLAVKVILSLLLGRPAEDYLDGQRRSHLERMRELTAARKNALLVDALLMDHAVFHLEADLRWIDLTTARLEQIAKEIQA
ncbi:MAG: PadR family transcriptional regulator [Gaiellales bacterium]|nr:PadR family transcriptional regulator [Gaiellales bacterium]